MNVIFIIIFFILILYFIYNHDKYIYEKNGDKYFKINDMESAKDNYYKVLIHEPDNKRIPVIREKINNIDNNIIINDVDDIKTKDINDYIINENIIDDIENYVIEDINNDFNENFVIDNINNDFNENLMIDNTNRNIGDNQNVHDSVVNNTIDSSIKKLKTTNKSNKKFNYIYNLLLTELGNNNDLTTDDKEKIKKTLNYINKNKTIKIRDKYFSDYLTTVVNNIIDNKGEKHDNMKLNLFYELRDCIKSDNSLYCNVGIANRIVNSLNDNNDVVVIKPKWALNEEMMSKCGVISKKFEKEYSVDKDDFNLKLKEKIKKELYNDYVLKNKILTAEQLNNEIKDWIDYI